MLDEIKTLPTDSDQSIPQPTIEPVVDIPTSPEEGEIKAPESENDDPNLHSLGEGELKIPAENESPAEHLPTPEATEPTPEPQVPPVSTENLNLHSLGEGELRIPAENPDVAKKESVIVDPAPETTPEVSKSAGRSSTSFGQEEAGDVIKKAPLKIFGHAIPGFIPPPASFMAWMRERSLASKRAKRQEKLDRLMTLFEKHKQIKNDQVEKFLHISDKTTQRYLNMLIKQGKIKRLNSGPNTCYEKI